MTLIDPSSLTPPPGKTADDVSAAVAWATGVIVGYCGGQLIKKVADDTVVLAASANGVQLPQFPVTGVSAVEVRTQDGWWSVPNVANLLWWQDGWLDLPIGSSGFIPPTWPGPSLPVLAPSGPVVRVTYDHGYDPVPDAVVGICTRLTRSYLSNPIGRTLRKVGDEETRYDTTVADFTDAEMRALDGFASVTVA